MKPLVVIPTYVTHGEDIDMVNDAVSSVWLTAGDTVDILVVDDGSPMRMPDLDLAEVVRQPSNEGFSRTVNVGLGRALEEGRDAILMNADVEIITPGWVEIFRRQGEIAHDLHRAGPAAVVGGLLLFPNGLIQHAGIYFSLLTRTFDHLYKYGPGNLPEAHVPDVRPVTGALQFIRHECLAEVGLYDERFRMGWEDVDYCIRVLLSGRECVYQPLVRAWHAESMFRGRPSDKLLAWQIESLELLMSKYATQSFAGLVPTL